MMYGDNDHDGDTGMLQGFFTKALVVFAVVVLLISLASLTVGSVG